MLVCLTSYRARSQRERKCHAWSQVRRYRGMGTSFLACNLTIVLFGFLRCPDVCPTSLSELAGLAERLVEDLSDLLWDAT